MNRDDLMKYKAMKAIINNGKYEIKGDAILTVASLLDWYSKLEKKIEEAIAEPALQVSTIETLEDKEE